MEAGLLTSDLSSRQRTEETRVVLDRRGWLYSMPVSKRPYNEPVKEEFIEINDRSHQRYVLRRWRKRIEEPLQYESFPGWIDIKLVGISVLRKEIKKALKDEGLFTDDRADRFVAAIKSAVTIYKSRIERALMGENFADFAETSHPLIAFLTIRDDTDVIGTALCTVEHLFPSQEDRSKIKNFIDKYRSELMTLKVVRRFQIHRA